MTNKQTEVFVDVQFAYSADGLPTDSDFSRWAHAAASKAGASGELVVRVVDEAESEVLNSRYRGKQAATNVLSFPAEVPPGADMKLLGDLAICAPVVQREAIEQGKDVTAHWAHMVVHGVLHLCGHDHASDGEAQRMESSEVEILADMGFPDPYAER